MSYLEIPVMCTYSFGTGDIKPYAMAGPSLGYLLSSEAKTTFEGYTAETDEKDNTKDFDFGLCFGGGVSMPVGSNAVFIEARYALGLTNTNDDPNDPNDTDVKTRGIQIFAGITFPLRSE